MENKILEETTQKWAESFYEKPTYAGEYKSEYTVALEEQAYAPVRNNLI